MESYRVVIKPSALRDLEAISKKDRVRIADRIRTLAGDPRSAHSKKLSDRRDAYRIRQGDYRVVYTVSEEDRLVMVAVIIHRRDAYR